MGVQIDETRQQDLSVAVDHLGPGGRVGASYLRDHTVGDQHVDGLTGSVQPDLPQQDTAGRHDFSPSPASR